MFEELSKKYNLHTFGVKNKIGYRTYVALTGESMFENECVEILYDQFPIVQHFKDGKMVLSGRRDPTGTIQRRLNEYMPEGFRVDVFQLDLMRIDSPKRYTWLLKTPSGMHPWEDESRWDLRGNRLNLSDAMNGTCARNLIFKIKDYAKGLIDVGTKEGLEPCLACMSVIDGISQEHLLDHINSNQFTSQILMRPALDSHLSIDDYATNCLRTNHWRWKKPKTDDEKIARVESLLQHGIPIEHVFDPRKRKAVLRDLTIRWLLKKLGYEIY